MRAFLSVSIALSVALACGCGGSSGSTLVCTDASTPNLDPTELLANLTPSDKAEYCDWWACRFGGYGAQVSCSSGQPVTIDSSQAECASKFPSASSSCTATVGDETECIQAIEADPCASVLFTSSQCENALQCAVVM